jgi:plastocyanin
MAVALATAPLRADEYHGINAGAPVWNGVIQFTPAKAAAIAATGCRAIRVNFRMDGHATWNPTLLAQYDTVIQTAENHGLVVLGLLCNEAMPVGQHAYNDDPDGDGMNDYVVGFRETARLLVERYRDRIKRWEIWNEPNAWTNPNYASDPQNAGGTYILPRVYANLLAETYKELDHYGGPQPRYNAVGDPDGRSILTDSRIVLVSGGLFAHEIGGSFSHAMDYMQLVYDQTAVWDAFEAATGRRYPWSIFGYHFYLATDTTITNARLNQYFNRVRLVQGNNNDPSPLFITEFGWNSASGVGEAGQANNMNIAYQNMEGKPYIVGTFWYQWVDEPYPWYWGITRADGSHKPSYDVFAAQQADNLPPPEPQVSISADRTEIAGGQTVQFTPTVSFFPGNSAVESVWHFGSEQQVVAGAPQAIGWTFTEAGEHDVYLMVKDTNHLCGYSNTVTVRVTVPPAYSRADFDQDGDVDQDDFAHFQRCYTGDGVPLTDPDCAGADLEGDGDVDLNDFNIFFTCISGANVPADPACGH